MKMIFTYFVPKINRNNKSFGKNHENLHNSFSLKNICQCFKNSTKLVRNVLLLFAIKSVAESNLNYLSWHPRISARCWLYRLDMNALEVCLRCSNNLIFARWDWKDFMNLTITYYNVINDLIFYYLYILCKFTIAVVFLKAGIKCNLLLIIFAGIGRNSLKITQNLWLVMLNINPYYRCFRSPVELKFGKVDH